MSHPQNRGERQTIRRVKGLRRVREDRAQHGADHTCACFDTSGRGVTFARFADHPTICSCFGCGNPRRFYSGVDALTRQEIRSADGDRS